MKKLLFSFLAAMFIASCSTDEVTPESNPTFQDVTAKTVQPVELDTELPPLPTGRRPITLSYWYNGLYLGNHSWTNGNCTYYQVVVAPGTQGAYFMLNHINGTAYWVTTHWAMGSGGCN